ncbi:MAG: penicillin acylase family protein, partial [Candidatus Hodarchaeales archaeon]
RRVYFQKDERRGIEMMFWMKTDRSLILMVLMLFSLCLINVEKTAKGEETPLEDARIIHDTWGVPHIYATNEYSLYYATGFVHAQDRLFQMEMFRRLVSGRLSEVIGSSMFSEDRYYRQLQLWNSAQASYEYMKAHTPDSPFLSILDAYVDGVNAYIDKLTEDHLPDEFKFLNYRPDPWTPVDSLAWGKMMEWNLAGQTYDLTVGLATILFGEERVNQLFPLNNTFRMIPVLPNYGSYENSTTKPAFQEFAINSNVLALAKTYQNILKSLPKSAESPFGIRVNNNPELTGSNNWVVGGNLSASGFPILANDMHLGWTMPPIWYECHQVILGTDFNVYGYSFPGQPLIIAGHNTHAAWGYTNVGADVCDYYYYTINPDNPNQYWNGTTEQWQDFEIIEEVFQVGEEAKTETFLKTGHGPIISNFKPDGATEDLPVALRWTGHDVPDELFKAVYYINRAHDLAGIIEAQRFWGVPAQNFVYADISGTIAMRPVGKYPIRDTRAGYWGRIPYNGSANENPWLGYIPYEELPTVTNPTQGFLSSTNQKTAGPDYPYFLGSFFAPGYRARRITDLLESLENQSATADDLKRFQGDNVDTAAIAFLPTLLSVNSTDNRTQDALDILAAWNGTMLKELVAPTIWRVWMDKFIELTFHDEYEAVGASEIQYPQWNTVERFVVYNDSVDWFDNTTTTNVNETIDDIAAAALNATLASLESLFGTTIADWQWGDYHKMRIDHPLGSILSVYNRGPYPWDGSGNTLNAAGGRIVKGGPSERIVYDLARLANGSAFAAYSVLPGGQSGNTTSSHYDDQLELFRAYEYHPAWFYDQPEEFPLADIEQQQILAQTEVEEEKTSDSNGSDGLFILIAFAILARWKYRKKARLNALQSH